MISVFIGGCPRSGTTMLGSLLGAHPLGAALPESQFKIEAVRGLSGEEDAAARARQIRHALRSHRFTGWHSALSIIDPQELERGSHREQIDSLVRAYLRTIGRDDAHFVVDHTPSNKNFFPTLNDLYPDARFIHMVRDGRAVASSVLKKDWGPNTCLVAAYWWLSHLAHGLAAERALGPERLLRVRYEDVLADPEREMASIGRWLGIEFSEGIVEPDTDGLDVRSQAFNPLAARAPVPERANAWRDMLSPRQVEMFESATRDMLGYLGYEADFGLSARVPGKRDWSVAGLEELFKGAANLCLYQFRRQRLKRKAAIGKD